jgi:hypothetical protein
MIVYAVLDEYRHPDVLCAALLNIQLCALSQIVRAACRSACCVDASG